MDEREQKMLNDILAKDPSDITDYDKAVLRARWHYVGRKSRDKFAEVMTQETKTPDENGTQDNNNSGSEKKNDTPNVNQHPGDVSQDDGEDE